MNSGLRTKPYRPREIFGATVSYLESGLWRRDGDDLGIWIDPHTGRNLSIGAALETQLERDGVSMLEEGAPEEAPSETGAAR